MIDSVIALVDIIHQQQLLEGEQLTELGRLRTSCADPRTLARHLIEKSWLTPYQVNQLFQKRGQDLVLGQYVLLERLGEGGMGQVFKARHRRLDRIVALKVIRREHLANQDAVRRFRREIQASAQLSHANIVMAYDADQVGETHFMVMEYVEGSDLSSLVKSKGPLPIAIACEYLRQAAIGFQHAHERGMVHRDVKPSNILVTRPLDASTPWGPSIKILDMGVARLLHPPEGLDSVSALTKEGRVVGTPDYMAPEQAANSAKADIRSDLYSLGCTFYHLLTGQAPYTGGTPMEKLLKHRVDPVPTPEKLRPDTPPRVVAIVRKLLAKKPEERFQTPIELAQALEALNTPAENTTAVQQATPRTGAASSPPPMAVLVDSDASAPMAIYAGRPPRPKRWALIFATIGIVLLGLSIFGLVLLLNDQKKKAQGPTAAEDPLAAPLKKFQERLADPRVNADLLRRDLIAFSQQHTGTPQALEAGKLLMKVPSPLDGLKLDGPPPVTDVVAVFGEARQRHWSPARTVAVHPESKLVASGGDDGTIRLWDLGTLKERQVMHANSGVIHWVAFLPDGRTLLSLGGDGSIRSWDVASGRELPPNLRLMTGSPRAAIALSPDGTTLALDVAPFGPSPPAVRLYDLRGLQKRTAPPQPRGPALAIPFRGIHSLAFSPNGKMLAAAGSDGGPGVEPKLTVQIWDVGGDGPKPRDPLTRPTNGGGVLGFSQDSHVVAVTGWVPGAGGSVLRWDVNKETPEPLADLDKQPLDLRALAFGPNGWLVVASSQGISLWDGTGAERKELYPFKRGHTHWVNSVTFVGLTPTLLSASQDTTVRQWTVTATDAKEMPARLQEPAGVTDAVALSFDGRNLVASWDADPDLRSWELPRLKDTKFRAAGPNALVLALSPDGQQIVTAGLFPTRPQVWSFATTPPTAEELPPVGMLRTLAAVYSPDGKTLAASFSDQTVRWCNLSLPAKERTWHSLGLRHNDDFPSLAFSPDGKTLAAACEGRKDPFGLRLWDVASGTETQRLATGSVTALAFAPDGKTLVTAGWDGANVDLNVWNLSASPIKSRPLPIRNPPTQGLQAIINLAFAPDGESLLAASRDGHVLTLGPSSGQINKSWRLAGPIRRLTVTADFRYFATANGNGTVYLFRNMR